MWATLALERSAFKSGGARRSSTRRRVGRRPGRSRRVGGGLTDRPQGREPSRPPRLGREPSQTSRTSSWRRTSAGRGPPKTAKGGAWSSAPGTLHDANLSHASTRGTAAPVAVLATCPRPRPAGRGADDHRLLLDDQHADHDAAAAARPFRPAGVPPAPSSSRSRSSPIRSPSCQAGSRTGWPQRGARPLVVALAQRQRQGGLLDGGQLHRLCARRCSWSSFAGTSGRRGRTRSRGTRRRRELRPASPPNPRATYTLTVFLSRTALLAALFRSVVRRHGWSARLRLDERPVRGLSRPGARSGGRRARRGGRGNRRPPPRCPRGGWPPEGS